MEHVCIPCDYSTMHKRDIDKHNKTHKHKISSIAYKKLLKKETTDNSMYKCSYCPAIFSSQSSMIRHKNKCKIDEFTLRMQLKDNEIIQLKQQKDNEVAILKQQLENAELSGKINHLEMTLKNKDELLKSKDDTIEILKNQSTITNTTTSAITNIATKTVSALTYLTTKHKNAPPLLQVEHEQAKKLLECDEHVKLEEHILIEYKEGRLDEFIGDIIVKHYKKEDPGQQSIWNSDVSRLSFLIKDIVGEESEWVKDKKGIKLRQLVIKPITIFIKELIEKWRIQQDAIGVDDLTREQLEKRMKDQEYTFGILATVDSGSLEDSIAQHLSPRFGLNKN